MIYEVCENAEFAIRAAMAADVKLKVTMPEHAADAVVEDALREG